MSTIALTIVIIAIGIVFYVGFTKLTTIET